MMLTEDQQLTHAHKMNHESKTLFLLHFTTYVRIRQGFMRAVILTLATRHSSVLFLKQGLWLQTRTEKPPIPWKAHLIATTPQSVTVNREFKDMLKMLQPCYNLHVHNVSCSSFSMTYWPKKMSVLKHEHYLGLTIFKLNFHLHFFVFSTASHNSKNIDVYIKPWILHTLHD